MRNLEINCLAIITARGGSKRIPRKNIRSFNGKPIIHYAIDAALKSGIFGEVMVSTDDAEMAEVSREAGAAVPFLRSPKNSNDFATTADVLLEVLEEYKSRGQTYDFVCCLYPTAPFVTDEKLKRAFRLMVESAADSLLPVTAFSFPIWRSLKIDEQGLVQFNWPENALKRSQDLPPAYHDCGQFYFLKTASFLSSRKMIMPKTVPMIVPESEVQDIDNEEDWKLAEIKYRFLQAKHPVADSSQPYANL